MTSHKTTRRIQCPQNIVVSVCNLYKHIKQQPKLPLNTNLKSNKCNNVKYKQLIDRSAFS